MASYVADLIRVICRYSTHPWVSPCGPAFGCSNLILSNLSGLLRSTISFPMNLSLLAQRKVTKRKDTPISLPCGSPHHSPLPTGRPDSPSGLDMTKSDVRVGFSLPKANTSANFMGAKPYKRRSLDATTWNPGLFNAATISRITEYIHVFCNPAQPEAVH